MFGQKKKKRIEEVIHTIVWKNLKNLNEVKQGNHNRACIVWFYICENVDDRQICKDKVKWLSIGLMGKGKQIMGNTIN